MDARNCKKLKEVMALHNLEKVEKQSPIKYEKMGLSVESRDDGETFIVRHGERIRICPGHSQLDDYLSTL
jgi:hypothetical protein